MKQKNIVIVLILFLTICLLYFILAVYQPGAGLYIKAEKLSAEPNTYAELASLDNYPYVKEAVSSYGNEVKVPLDDEGIKEFKQIIQSNNTQNIKVYDEYFKINIYYAD